VKMLRIIAITAFMVGCKSQERRESSLKSENKNTSTFENNSEMFQESDLVVICLNRQDQLSLTLRYSGSFTGPSSWHEPHLKGEVSRVALLKQSSGAAVEVEIENGILDMVGEAENLGVRRLNLTSFGSGNDQRGRVDMVTSSGTKMWSTCRFGKAFAKIRSLGSEPF